MSGGGCGRGTGGRGGRNGGGSSEFLAHVYAHGAMIQYIFISLSLIKIKFKKITWDGVPRSFKGSGRMRTGRRLAAAVVGI